MNALAQRIAARQHADQAFRECLNDGDLQSKPRVLDANRKRPAVAQQATGTVRKLVDAFKQTRGRTWCAQISHRRAALGKAIERYIDAIERAVILAAILQVIDDLQRRAEGIIGRPGNPAFTMYVEHEAS